MTLDGDPAPWRRRAAAAARRGFDQVGELTGRAPEAVVATRSEGSGWVVDVDVVEVHRVPPTTDVMATFRLRLDADGEVLEWERLRRWVRGRRSRWDPSR